MREEHSEIGWAYGVIYDDLKSCGCGIFESRMELLRQALRDCPLFEDSRYEKYQDPMAEWFLCLLDGAELIDHGTSISGSWITEKGSRLLAVLEDEASWNALVNDEPPMGYCPVKDCPDCKRT